METNQKFDYLKFVGSIFLYKNKKVVVYAFDPLSKMLTIHYLKEYNTFAGACVKTISKKKELHFSSLSNDEKRIYFIGIFLSPYVSTLDSMETL